MNLDDVDSVPFPNSIDSTMLSSFASCPMSFYYEFILRRVPSGTSIHLHAGGCYALALEVARRAIYEQGADVHEALNHAFPHFVKAWGTYTEGANEAKDFYNVWGAVCYYLEKAFPPGQDGLEPLMTNGKCAAEFNFALPTSVRHPVTGQLIMLSGRMDLVAREINSGLIVGLDDKTTKSLGASWPYQWGMRGQFYGYTYALREHGIDAGGMVVRGIAIQKTQYNHAEHVMPLSNALLERWWVQINQRIERMVQLWHDMAEIVQVAATNGYGPDVTHSAAMSVWPMSFGDACNSYGGCQYAKELCVSTNPWDYYRDYDFRVWDPLAANPAHDAKPKLLQMEPVHMPDELMRLLS